ncbi:hypothetical protein JOC77_001006 [Peribacillus deserti]|uniref:Uncharacterized protein n=1 Tax=Peribacillus deserti TaxID=673318 RepID=A0ABS2QEN5_9BACI|nr:hypothetical protein [Peribacillus deserti]
MGQLDIHYIILTAAIMINGLGCIYILKKDWVRYGLVLIISLMFSSSLCYLFYVLHYYRFVLPLFQVMPAVAISFSFLVLFLIRFRPKKHTFPFFYSVLIFIFSIEVLLKDYWGFIRFSNGWDYWDSFSLYWVYSRVFDHIGEFFVSAKYRTPIRAETRIYWFSFFAFILYGCFLFYWIFKMNH